MLSSADKKLSFINFTMVTVSDFVNESKKIIIAGHLGPDYDAYASVLFTGLTIKENFKDKEVVMLLDTKTPFDNISYLPGFKDITYEPLIEKVHSFQPDLIILVDSSQRFLFTNKPNELKAYTQTHKSILLDHHLIVDTDFDLHINNDTWSCVEVIYDQLIRKEGLKTFKDWETVYLTGLIGDSYRFYYETKKHRDTLNTVSDIIDRGYSIRTISDKLFGYSRGDILLLSKLSANVHFEKNFAYTYLSHSQFEKEIKPFVDSNSYKKTKRFFMDEILNKVYDIDFCFVLAPGESNADPNVYFGSLRAKANTINTTVLAKEFPGGGGYITGSGFDLKAPSIEDAISQVLKVIEEKEPEARIN